VNRGAAASSTSRPPARPRASGSLFGLPPAANGDWAVRYESQSYPLARGIAEDASGDVVFWGAQIGLTGTLNDGALIGRVTADGTPVAAVKLGETQISAVALTPSGATLVHGGVVRAGGWPGTPMGPFTIGADAELNPTWTNAAVAIAAVGTADGFVVLEDLPGLAISSFSTAGVASSSHPFALTVDLTYMTFVQMAAGAQDAWLLFYTADPTQPDMNQPFTSAVAHVSDVGDVLSEDAFAGEIWQLAVTPAGGLVLVGSGRGSLLGHRIGTADGSWIVSFDATGAVVFEQDFPMADMMAVAVAPDGTIAVHAEFQPTQPPPWSVFPTPSTTLPSDSFLAALAADGTPLWARLRGSSAYGVVPWLAWSTDGAVLINACVGDVFFGIDVQPMSTRASLVVAKLHAPG
jgi:hypothetical protein